MVKTYVGPILTVLFVLCLLYTMAMFIVPFLSPPDTLRHLDGYGNRVDNADKYESIDPFSRFIYTFADSQCHQKEDRSYVLNGNEMPMCSRCTALFFFANLGFISAVFLRPDNSLSKTFLSMFPKRLARKVAEAGKEPHFMAFVVLAMVAPLALDGTMQLVTPYESTNALRVITGLFSGWVGGLVLGLILNNIWYFVMREGPDDPRGWRTRPGDDKRLAEFRERRRREWELREKEYNRKRDAAEKTREAEGKGKAKEPEDTGETDTEDGEQVEGKGEKEKAPHRPPEGKGKKPPKGK